MPNDKTAAEVLADIGRVLNPGDDWQARLARELGVGRNTIGQLQRGHLAFGPDHGLLDDLLALTRRREADVRGAREELEAWLQRNRK